MSNSEVDAAAAECKQLKLELIELGAERERLAAELKGQLQRWMWQQQQQNAFC